jgi:hypothetical protein
MPLPFIPRLCHCSVVRINRMPNSILALAFSNSARAWAMRSIWARILGASGWSACLHQRFEHGFFLIECGAEIDQLQAALLKDVIHLLLLIGRQRQSAS